MFATLITMTLALMGGTEPCEYEDGSTQDACVYDDGHGAVVLNLGHGEITITLRSWTTAA